MFFLEFDLNFVWTNFDFSFFSVFARFFWNGFSNVISLVGINDFRLESVCGWNKCSFSGYGNSVYSSLQT